jgi:Na+-transporting methylmalonyl-CoA/oxaloacetate decarboxylase gamma subunit
MTLPRFLLVAAGLPANPTLLQLAEFAAAGLAVVLLSLSLLALFCSAVGHFFQRSSARATPQRQSAVSSDALTEETVAVIAAAVAAVVALPHRVVHIRGLTAEEMGWMWGGRIQHHTSHKDTHRSFHGGT